MAPTPSVTVIGLGVMGFALAETILKSGFTTTVWNRTVEKAAPLEAKGARVAKTATEAIEASKIIIICVLDHNVVDSLLNTAGPLLQDRIVVNYTNGHPSHAFGSSKIVIANGGKYVHGAIFHFPLAIGNGAVIIHSGPKDVYDSVFDTIKVLGEVKYYEGDIGTASYLDNAFLSAFYGLFAGLTHSASLIHATKKLPMSDFADLLVPVMSGITEYFHIMAKQLDKGEYATEGAALVTHLPAIQNIVDLSKDNGVTTDLISPIQALMQRAVKDGRGGDDASALVEYAISKDNQK